jgi:hypothetical protein
MKLNSFLIVICCIFLTNIQANATNITYSQTWDCANPINVPSNEDLIINAGVTLSINNCNTFTIPNNLILMEGAYLVINNSIISMNTQKAVKLKKNSRIIADGSYFKGAFWQGFIFDNLELIGTDVPGAIKLTNSHVDNAIVVFQGYNGGNIYSTNCKFYNFSKFLYLAHYSYQNTSMFNQCFFRNCDIYKAQCPYNPGIPIVDTWINVSNVPQTYNDNGTLKLKGKGARFVDCKFLNSCGDVYNCFNIENSTIGLKGCIFSGFPESPNKNGRTITFFGDPSCQEMFADIDGCSFIPYTYYHTDYSNASQLTLNFVSCIKAITIIGCASANIISNNMVLQSNGIDERYGIFLGGCSGFKLEDNTITATATSGDPYETYGIIIQDANEQTNQVYRNTLINCHYGIRAQGKNRGTAIHYYNPAQGLKFLCNDFSSFNTAYYMSCVKAPNTTSAENNSISKFQQGALSTSATDESPNFNRTPDRGLTGTQYDFYVDGSLSGYNINYLEPSNLGAYEIHYKSSNVSKGTGQIPPGSPAPCESRLPVYGPSSPVTISPIDIGNIYPAYIATLYSLKNMVNNDDHDYFFNMVLNVSASNMSDVYNELLNSTPSYDILALTCINSIFSNQMIEDILVTNSYGIKSGEVRDALRDRNPQLDQQQLDNIYTASENLSKFESLMMQVDNMNTEYIRLMNESINILYHRDEVPIDSIKLYLTAISDFYSIIKLIDFAFREGNLTQAQSLFETISETTNDQEEIIAYSSLYNDVLYDIYANHGGDFSNMNSSQIAILYSLIDNHTYSDWIAKYLLSIYTDYQWEEVFYPIESQYGERKGKVYEEPNKIDNLEIYPNPAQKSLIIKLPKDNLSNILIIISDLSGRVVLEKYANLGENNLDISQLSNGLYSLRIKLDGDITTSKLIINN